MAWTEQAFRHSIVGIVDPAQAEDNYQWGAALGNVALAGEPGAALASTISEFVTNFDGTHVAPVFAGDVEATLGAFTTNFDGTHVAPVFTGAIDATLNVFVANLDGTYTPLTFTGVMDATLSAFTSNFDGTHVAPVFTGDADVTLSSFTVSLVGTDSSGLKWDYDEDLTLTITPLPDTGFDVTTRYAIANVPAVALSDSIDRQGSVESTISGLTTSLAGSFVKASVDGDVSATLSGFTSSLVGAFQFRHYFDIGYSITPTWVVYEQPANFGDIDVTPASFVFSATGYSLPPDSTQGSIDLTLSGFTGGLTGTHTSASSFDGDLQLDIEVFTTTLAGTAFETGTTGASNVTLSGFTPSFDGTSALWNTDGAFSNTLDDFTLTIEGAFIDASAIFGVVDAVLSGFTTSFIVGTNEGDYITGSVSVNAGVGGSVSITRSVSGTINIEDS